MRWHSAKASVPEKNAAAAKATGIIKCVEGLVADIVKPKLDVGRRRVEKKSEPR